MKIKYGRIVNFSSQDCLPTSLVLAFSDGVKIATGYLDFQERFTSKKLKLRTDFPTIYLTNLFCLFSLIPSKRFLIVLQMQGSMPSAIVRLC